MDISELKQRYESACNDFVKIFCEKQGMEFEGWVADDVGGIANCSDFFFNLSDIVLDVTKEQPKGKIVKWYDDNCLFEGKSINYYSYIHGLRIKDLA